MNHKRIENVFLICLMLGIYTVFVSNTGTGFPCLFRYFTHLQCPGCGVTHMLLELLHGNFREAYNAHPVLLLWGPFLLWLVLKSLYAYITDKDLRLRTWEKVGMYIFLVVLFVFFVYRNLP